MLSIACIRLSPSFEMLMEQIDKLNGLVRDWNVYERAHKHYKHALLVLLQSAAHLLRPSAVTKRHYNSPTHSSYTASFALGDRMS